MRLIDADGLIDLICSGCCGGDGSTKCRENCVDNQYISAMPTIDAEPVRHGSWNEWTRSCFTRKYNDYDEPEFKDYKYYSCSECYRKSAIKEFYCPSCGAKMDKE